MLQNSERRRQVAHYFRVHGEEAVNSLTHGIGAALAVVALVVLVVLALTRGTAWHLVSYTVYGVCLVALFLASTLFHGARNPRKRTILRRVDHACIYLLIAGTYTPFALIAMRGPLGWSILGIVWGLAVLGILFKIFFIDRWVVASTLAYVAMGWLGIVAYRQMLGNIPPAGLALLLAGGVVYTAGVVFYARSRIPYNHAVWHLFVLGGSACHFLAVSSLIAAG